ncbi:MAG: hypothetical protein EON95_04975 [Caulobacteraceae bacterium]|nr:MAG: hypothetical protein EON95_04975 [Caulobacteraceae bacterium]
MLRLQMESDSSSAINDDPPKPAGVKNPLEKYSLLGRADEIEAGAASTKPLLGDAIMQGQATMIYAEPNTGKTLITLNLCLQAIEAKRIDAANLYYINADDSSEGLACKLRLMQDVGAHMLAPGFNGFRSYDLIQLLVQAVDGGSARGTCVVVDTLKKFTDLMDKKRSSAFAEVCRQYVMAGGTIVALGHTAKNPNADGTPRYQGTTDILEDFDAIYVAQPLTSKGNATQKVVKLTRKKCRADSPEAVAYAYDAVPGESYEAKLASVRPVDPDDLYDYAAEGDQVGEGEILGALVQLIEAGSTSGKMALARAAAGACGVSHRRAVEALDRMTGNTPNDHLWAFEKGPRGVRNYRLIDQTTGGV